MSSLRGLSGLPPAASARALLLLALAGSLAAAAPLKGTDTDLDDRRIIVRYADSRDGRSGEFPSLQTKMAEIEGMQGVLLAKALSHIGMAIVHCDSSETEERLVEELEQDPLVELVVPDTWVHLDEGGAGAAAGVGEAARLAEGLREKATPPRRLSPAAAASSSGLCSAQPACVALHFTEGRCCPTIGGFHLDCCSSHDWPRVSLRSYHGKYVTTRDSKVIADSDAEVAWSMVRNSDGTYSLQDQSGRYVSFSDRAGAQLRCDQDEVGPDEKFALEANSNHRFSLRSHAGKYVAAEPWGGLFANRANKSLWEQFDLRSLVGPSQLFPDDEKFAELWGMNNYGGYDIDAPEAWEISTGADGPGIVVAVIDTGIDYTHPDLRDQMWVNPGEIPGNGIDDDGNGVIDDVHGADFANEDGDPLDDQKHGTHCSGTIAGVGDNGLGVAGVAWRGVRLMALKFLRASGSGRASDALRALNYAVAHGARIASNSWGGGASNSALRAAIERAEAAGVLFVAAAGNSGSNNDEDPHYPSSYDVGNVIAVASVTREGNLSSFSCYGSESVDVAAPGSSILSTAPGNRYAVLSGTSMACPHVSGLAALLWMYRPSLTMAQVKEVVMASVAKLDSLEGKMVSGGLVNAKNALEAAWGFQAPAPPLCAPSKIEFKDVNPKVGQYGGTVTITAAADERDVDFYKVYFVSGAGFQLEALGQANATGAREVAIRLNGSFAMPQYGASLVAVAGNATGEQPTRSHPGLPQVHLEDYGEPEHGPSSVRWAGDADRERGSVRGALLIGRAADETSISDYNVYWRKADGARGDLIGSVAAASFRKPYCSGKTCGAIGVEELGGGKYTFERHPYGDEEKAVFSLSGPGEVRITLFGTEKGYDSLKVGGSSVTGIPHDLPKVLPLGKGLQTIKWESDSSKRGAGWRFELMQGGSQAAFEISAVKPDGCFGVEVVPAFRGSEVPSKALYAEVVDSDDEMPPSGAFKPASIRFVDLDHTAGVVRGSALVEVSAEAVAQPEAVTYYVLHFADAQGARAGLPLHAWIANVDGGSAVAFRLGATEVPQGATQLMVRAGNEHGLSHVAAYAELVDAVDAAAPAVPDNSSSAGDLEGETAGEPDGAEGAAGGPPMESSGGAAAAADGADGATPSDLASGLTWPLGESEPWLPTSLEQAERPQVLWTAAAAAAGDRQLGSVKSALTVPGMPAAAAASLEFRRALARAVALALPRTSEGDVRVLRVLWVSSDAAKDVVPGGRRLSELVRRSLSEYPSASTVEFEVLAGRDALDRIESRVLVLALGGGGAARLDDALRREMLAAGVPAPAAGWLRSRVAEPKQLTQRSRAVRAARAATVAAEAAAGPIVTQGELHGPILGAAAAAAELPGSDVAAAAAAELEELKELEEEEVQEDAGDAEVTAAVTVALGLGGLAAFGSILFVAARRSVGRAAARAGESSSLQSVQVHAPQLASRLGTPTFGTSPTVEGR